MKWLTLTAVGLLCHLLSPAQEQPILGLEAYFEEAYWRYPNVPRGILEAMAYSASRITNLQPQPNESGCTGMPQRHGLFALVKDGRGYFKNNLLTVCEGSQITPDQYNADVRLQILSVAKFLSREASFRQITTRMSKEAFAVILEKLAEFPDDSSAVNQYALALFKYDIYDHLRNGFNAPSLKRAPVKVQLEQIFPAPLLQKLRSPAVGFVVKTPPKNKAAFTTSMVTPAVNRVQEVTNIMADYSPAVYVTAAPENYQSGRNGVPISYIALHTTQASYAAAISWFKNPAAHMSAHYIVRASDGQVTQMVKENDRALHLASQDLQTIAIQHEGYQENGNKWYTDKLYKASAALVRDICARRNIDEGACYQGMATDAAQTPPANIHIKGHQQYSGNTHADPGKYWNWTKYAVLLTAVYEPDVEKTVRYKTIPNGIYRINNVQSNKVLNTRECSGNQLAKITQAAWTGKSCQQWRFEFAGEGWYRIMNVVSGRALEIPNGTKENVQLVLKDVREHDSQLWRLLETTKGALKLENKASGKVLDVFGGSASNGAAVLQTAWMGKPRQQWMLAPVSITEEANEIRRYRQVFPDSTQNTPVHN